VSWSARSISVPGGEREAVDVGDVVRLQALGLVYADELGRGAAAQRDHVDLAVGHRHQVEARGGGAVAEQRRLSAAAGQHRRPQPCAQRQARVADGVDAAAVRMQPPSPQSQLDRAATDPGGEQLRVRDHSLLACGQFGDHRIDG
jgi:hypothetical protein